MSYDFDYFSGTDIKSPVKPTKPTLGRNPTAIDARAFADALEEYEREFRSYEEDKSYYQSQRTDRFNQFRVDLQKEYSLNDSEFNVIWSEAYDRGHSGGLQEVYGEFDRLFDFVVKYAETVKKK